MPFRLFFISIMLFGVIVNAQDVKTDSIKEWKTEGKVTFLFNQSSFSNWASGGESNVAGNIGLNYNFNYTSSIITWDNKLLASYGLTKTKNLLQKKTDDRLEFSSIIGKKAKGYWYYSAVFNFKTQFATGYKYGKDVNGAETKVAYTNFMSPAYVLFGPGMLWKKSDKFKFNLAPATARLIIVDKAFTLPNKAYFGVKEGGSSEFELGFNILGLMSYDIMKNVSMEHIINIFSNYLGNPQNINLDYTLNIVMKINKYLTTNMTFQTIYEDAAYKGFQVRELVGIGVNYGF